MLHRFVQRNLGRLPIPGEVWHVSGELKNHQEYGPQVHVSEATLCPPRGRLLIDFLARHEAFDGLRIGVTKASALYAHFGEDLYDVLEDGNEELLAKVGKLPKETIHPLVEAWQKVAREANVIRWLSGWNCPLGLARKLIDYYGKEALDKLHDNPYRMLAFTSFKKCDEMARRTGIDLDDPRRLAAVVQNILYQHLDQGHTVMDIGMLENKVSAFVGPIGVGITGKAINAAKAARVIVVSNRDASPTGIRLLEMDAMGRVEAILTEAQEQQVELFSTAAAVAAALAEFESESGYALNAEQKVAVTMALKERFSVICGGAGVGKTTVLKALVKLLSNEIYLMALTGQAARRIAQATGRLSSTIEYFLRHVAGNISRDSKPLLVIDEASMLDLQLTARILRACPKRSRLLFVGDPAQLPPVSFGLIFHKLAESPRVPKTELTIINRQTEESGIPEVSRQIRAGRVPALQGYPGLGSGVSFIAAPREDVIQKVLDVKADLPKAQILCVKNAGGLGIQDVNEIFHRLKAVGRQTEESVGMSVQEPVIFKKNIADLDLVNGSLGKITGFERDDDGSLQVLCSFSRDKKSISGPYLEFLKLAYAITVHSAQGSQFERVVIVVEPSQILDRTLIYTALTRGVQQVVFVGDEQAFRHAIYSEPKASQRSVLFRI
jgi:exodeoxyribonuclease V alpha subunit